VLQTTPGVGQTGAMALRAPVEILVAGHYCHDTIVGKDGGRHQALGGSAAYGSAVLQAMGVDFRAIAKVGGDFRYRNEVLAEPLVIESARTTSFVDDYTSGERRETLEALCEPIAPDDIDREAKIAIACP